MDGSFPVRIELSPVLWRRPWWLYGRPAELWVRHRDQIAAAVKKFDLKPIPPEHLFWDDAVAVGGAGKAEVPIRPRPFPGGMRMPHLHLADKVYQLEPEQWKAFSSEIMKGLQDRIARAGTVSVGQLLEVSEAVNDLG